jgi:hypothetical protein
MEEGYEAPKEETSEGAKGAAEGSQELEETAPNGLLIATFSR